MTFILSENLCLPPRAVAPPIIPEKSGAAATRVRHSSIFFDPFERRRVNARRRAFVQRGVPSFVESGGRRDQSWPDLGYRVAAGSGLRLSRRRRGRRAFRDESRADVHRPRNRVGVRARFSSERRFAARSEAQGRALRRQHGRPFVLDRRPRDDPGRCLPLQSAGGAPAAECSASSGRCSATSAAHIGFTAPASGGESAAASSGRHAAASSASAVAVADLERLGSSHCVVVIGAAAGVLAARRSTSSVARPARSTAPAIARRQPVMRTGVRSPT